MQFELAQESVKKEDSDFHTTDIMKEYCERVISEGCVLLENDGVLPLEGKKISLFGRCQIDTFYAGYGSGGDVKSPYKISLYEGFLNAKANLNLELLEKYIEWTSINVPDEGTWGNWPLCFPEMKFNEVDVKNAAQISDVAVVVIGRSAGEDRDIRLEKGSWYLTDEEKEMLGLIRKHFAKMCILINSGSIMDTSEILEYTPNALMYIWQGGQEMGTGVAKVLLGEASPSGKLTGTIAKIEDYPSFKNFGYPEYNCYEEDIYVGYRFFNTFSVDKIIYPFGYGLSYSNFSYNPIMFSNDRNIITGKIIIKNTGKYSAKETIQLYLSKPQGRLGNPSLELIYYKKTKELAPNEEQLINVCIDISKFASYDDTNKTGNINCYVLENGVYTLSCGFDSLSVSNIYEFELDNTVVVKKTKEACAPTEVFKRLVNNNKPSYEDVPLGKVNIMERILNYIPNNNEPIGNYYTYDQLKAGEVTLDEFVNSLDIEELEAITRGSLYSMNSPFGPAGNAATFGACNDKLFKRGIPAASTNDGPSGVRLAVNSTQVPNGVMIASTFNDELIKKLAYEIGSEVKARKSHVILAPGLNIHRSPLCGRNFEYYSEDPYLTGMIASAYVSGVQDAQVASCPKHFACNNQEFNRHINDSRLSQRALREIYLKGFDICIKESKPKVIMTSYNKINGEFSYYSHDLVRIILREEMEYDGLVITDWWMRDDSSKLFEELETQAYRIRATVDVYMPGSKIHSGNPGVIDGTIFKSVEANSLKLSELRYCAKNVLSFILRNL